MKSIINKLAVMMVILTFIFFLHTCSFFLTNFATNYKKERIFCQAGMWGRNSFFSLTKVHEKS